MKTKAELIRVIEARVRTMSFIAATEDLSPTERDFLRCVVSIPIQARLEFDAVCQTDLAKMSPNQIKVLSETKRELMKQLSAAIKG